MTVCCLSIAITILWMDTTVALIDSPFERVSAFPYVFQASAYSEAVEPFEMTQFRCVQTKLAVGFIAVGVQELSVEGITSSLQFQQEIPELSGERIRIVPPYIRKEVNIPPVLDRLLQRLVILTSEQV